MSSAAAQCDLFCPFVESIAGACRDSRSRHAGLNLHLSSLCLDQEETSHAKTCPPQAAAQSQRWQQLTPIFFHPLWHSGRFFPQLCMQPDMPVPKSPLQELLGVERKGE